MKKQLIIFLFTAFITSTAFTQKTQFSLATDISLLRSIKEEQRYWAIGQTIAAHFHFTPKDGAYALLCYYTDGKFSNELTADAKASTTLPQQLGYTNNARLRFKHISLGWKRYIKGTFNSEKTLNIYGYAGFGLMMGRIVNTHSPSIDTSLYITPVQSGKSNFKRLTFDVALAGEYNLGANIYIYLEGRTLIPTTDFPSPYLLINENAPFTVAANVGLRILFD